MSTVTVERSFGTPSARRRYEIGRADKVVAILLVIGLACLFLWPFTVFRIPSGDVGVIYRLLAGGTDTSYVFSEGLGFKWPWNRLYIYEMRTQALDETVYGLAEDGLSINVAVAVLYHPVREEVGSLQKLVGPDYRERLVRPLTVEAVRNIIGQIGPHDAYRFDVDLIEAKILEQLKNAPMDFIDYVGVIVRNIQLPPSLNAAITRKLTAEQDALAYDYIIQKAKKEAERKRIDAIGIQTFYSIVADALSPQLLTWRGIEATVQIAQSKNAKVVIVGGGKDQLPLILGSDIASQPALPSPAAVDPAAHQLPPLDDLPTLFPGAEPPREPAMDGAPPGTTPEPGAGVTPTPSDPVLPPEAEPEPLGLPPGTAPPPLGPSQETAPPPLGPSQETAPPPLGPSPATEPPPLGAR